MPHVICLDIGRVNGLSLVRVAKMSHECTMSLDISEQSIRELFKRNSECITAVMPETYLPFMHENMNVYCVEFIEYMAKAKEENISNETKRLVGKAN